MHETRELSTSGTEPGPELPPELQLQLQGITATTRDEHTQNQLQQEFPSLLPLQIVAPAREEDPARAAKDGAG